MRKFLNKEELRESVPAIFAEEPVKEVSDRYSFVSSEKIIDDFEKLGWYPTEAKTCNTKNEVGRIFKKHLIKFGLKEQILNVGDLFPELLQYNSHDRSTSWRLDMGLNRVLCGNGLVIADSTISSIVQKHVSIDFDILQEMVFNAITRFKVIAEKIEDYKTIELTEVEKGRFAYKAREAHWGKNSIIDPAALLDTRRPEDEGNSLWNTFNVIQENIIKGGISYAGQNEEGKVRRRRTREIKNITRDLNINVVLWAIMENFRVYKQF